LLAGGYNGGLDLWGDVSNMISNLVYKAETYSVGLLQSRLCSHRE
jgi:hypothetical protein